MNVCKAPAPPQRNDVAKWSWSAFLWEWGGGGSEKKGGWVGKWGGLVWFGSRLAPKVVTHGQCACISPAQLGTPLWLSGLTAAQTADDPRTSSRRWREGDAAVPVCVGARAVGGPWGGGGAFKAGAHLLSFSCGPWLACVGGCVCLVLRALAAGHGCPTRGC